MKKTVYIKTFDSWIKTTDPAILGTAERVFGDLRSFYGRFVAAVKALRAERMN
jgi:hypothetical protein